MSLELQINNDIKEAMKAKDRIRLEALRGVKKEVLEAKTAKGAAEEISDADVMKIVQKMVKQRKDAAELFASQNREDLAEKELAEVEAISVYLPAQLTQEELVPVVKTIIEKVGATSMKEMGKVMGVASKELAGKADGKDISAVVKQLLG
ncbi:GatB/YqeY domain-containing protein [Carboxylicivirga mesophila]|uniref:GatB/YqeY domain-containing protein n=1 Tax=Carboxylicivirga mesophila TaxID=1166478 RepID=A0ABS5KCP9_9BACT|nr:GatB/YqeY domain-containing protein [Carboxylicivirga mesophila]MBS2212741.1 GatB/YqeY domain-containing protein [Carboxylicivirga mesophila]